jgi:Zn-dependent protease with chaperone function
VLLFLLAVIALIMATNLLVVFTIWSMDGEESEAVRKLVDLDQDQFLAQFTGIRILGVTLAVTGVVLCAMVFRRMQLSEGGRTIAESLGGTPIDPCTSDPDQRKVINVVEEMALASGMPVPPVYLLSGEFGINAFAAGNTPADAVIGVTRGCIEQLDRPQLQGVIAHEFSHIFNGDMRLNMRLIAILYGIVFIGTMGEVIVRSFRHSAKGRHSRKGGQLLLLGIGLVLVGWLGSFFGKMIKSAVTRQREYLADASAVQFTRNPAGIADALKVIGGHSQGTRVTNPHAGEVSHLFFGQSLKYMLGLFDTHPPLEQRIRRIEPRWDGSFAYLNYSRRKKADDHGAAGDGDRGTGSDARHRAVAGAMVGAVVLAGIDGGDTRNRPDLTQARKTIDGLPTRMHRQAHDPLGAIAVTFVLLLGDDPELQDIQFSIVAELPLSGLVNLCRQLVTEREALDREHRLPLLQLCLPALRLMSEQQYRSFEKTLLRVILADKRIDIFEWCLFQLVRHYLSTQYGKVKPSKAAYGDAHQVADAYRLVMSMLAHHGHPEPDRKQQRERAFVRGTSTAGLYTLSLMPLEECSMNEFSKSVRRLADCKPLLKPRLLRGLEHCAMLDKVITAEEREIITAIAALMDTPVPDFRGVP